MVDVSGTRESNDRSIPIEWNWDMDNIGLSIPALDDVTEFKLRTRCQRCWGRVRGRTDPERNVTGMRCLDCGRALEGQAAADEEDRISKESFLNAVNSDWGIQAKYSDGSFARKVFPEIDRLSKQELLSRVALGKGHYAKSPGGTLTRHDFQAGSPGWLFLQARLLIDGASKATDYGRDSVADFPTVKADGSVSVRIDTERMSENPRTQEQELLSRVGSLLGHGMIGAFACELALKAISLTCTDEATKTHQLLQLFDELPPESRDRLAADFSTIRDVLATSREAFGAWRYFETAVGKDAFSGMIDPERSRSLMKAARVILDEGEYVGLTAGINVKAKRRVRVTGEQRQRADQIDFTIRGGECPPRT